MVTLLKQDFDTDILELFDFKQSIHSVEDMQVFLFDL